MEQVYAAVYDDLGLVLIGQKRHQNRFWQGQLKSPQAKKTVVNQSDQFCLPGGSLERSTIPDGARKEFLEETGVELSEPIARLTHMQTFHDSGYTFHLAMFKHRSIFTLVEAIQGNLKPSTLDNERPAGAGVVDWELQQVLAVDRMNLSHFLGNPVEPHKSGYRHAIDWYGRIARYIEAMSSLPA